MESRDDDRVMDLLYGQDADADDAAAPEVARMRELRGMFREFRDATDAEPSSNIAILMAAARERKPAPQGVWARLRAWFGALAVHPGMAAAATVVVVGGVAGALYVNGRGKFVETTAPAAGSASAPAPAETPPMPPGAAAGSGSAADPFAGSAAGSASPGGSGTTTIDTTLVDQRGAPTAPAPAPEPEKHVRPADTAVGAPRAEHYTAPRVPTSTGAPELLEETEAPARKAPGTARQGATAGGGEGRGGAGSAPGAGGAAPVGADDADESTDGMIGDKSVADRPTAAEAPPPPPPAPAPQVAPTAATPAPKPAAKPKAPTSDAAALTDQARVAARRRDCKTVGALAGRVRAIDVGYYNQNFAPDAEIQQCNARAQPPAPARK